MITPPPIDRFVRWAFYGVFVLAGVLVVAAAWAAYHIVPAVLRLLEGVGR